MPNSEIHIGLLWHSPNSGNLGVGALTMANISIAREAASSAGVTPKFRILGFVDAGMPTYVHGDDIEVVALNSAAMVPGGLYWRCLRDLDVILDIGAGDSFADIYGLKRFAFIFLSKAIAIGQKRPLVLSPQTIGPFSKQPQSSLAGWAMDRAAAVVARDPISMCAAQKIAPRAKLTLSIDVAFRLPFDPPIGPRSGVGINVSGLLFNGGYSGANEFGLDIDYAKFSEGLIQEFVRRGETVHLISHVNSDTLPADDDRRVADRLALAHPNVVRAPNFASPVDAKTYIAARTFLVGGRMHACIAAYSSGVPVVPVAYSRKFAGLFEGVLGYSSVLPVKGLNTAAAIEFVVRKWEQRAELSQEIATGMTLVDEGISKYRDLLHKIFVRLARV